MDAGSPGELRGTGPCHIHFCAPRLACPQGAIIVSARAVRVVVATKPVDFCKGHDGFSGVLQVDGYAAYKTVSRGRGSDAPLCLADCWAHGRRKLREIFDSDTSPIAEEGLRRIAERYEIEADIRGPLGIAGRDLPRLARCRPRSGLGQIAGR